MKNSSWGTFSALVSNSLCGYKNFWGKSEAPLLPVVLLGTPIKFLVLLKSWKFTNSPTRAMYFSSKIWFSSAAPEAVEAGKSAAVALYWVY